MLANHLDPLAASLFSLLAIASLLLAFVMLGSRWLKDYMLAFAAQSWLIGILARTDRLLRRLSGALLGRWFHCAVSRRCAAVADSLCASCVA
ncbi:hypothetical protein [Rhodanobacter lindaniclasticus]